MSARGRGSLLAPQQLDIFFLLHRRTIELIILTGRGKAALWMIRHLQEGSDNGAKLLGNST